LTSLQTRTTKLRQLRSLRKPLRRRPLRRRLLRRRLLRRRKARRAKKRRLPRKTARKPRRRRRRSLTTVAMQRTPDRSRRTRWLLRDVSEPFTLMVAWVEFFEGDRRV